MASPLSHLSPYSEGLIAAVTERTGYPLVVTECVTLPFDSEIRMALQGRATHELRYRLQYSEHCEHFIVNAAAKILRFWDVPRDHRFVPASSASRGLPRDEYRELARKLPSHTPVQTIDEVSRFLFFGLVRQLTSFPLDLRVERELHDELPQHRAKQRAYLAQQVGDFTPTLDVQMLDVIPERCYTVSAAMNIAFAEEAARLSGSRVPGVFRRHGCRDIGERLHRLLDEVDEAGHVGDRTLADRWADALGLRSWYEWRSV